MAAVMRHIAIVGLIILLGSLRFCLADEPTGDSAILETITVPDDLDNAREGIIESPFPDHLTHVTSAAPASFWSKLIWKPSDSYWTWTADYRTRSYFDSHTSQQFGMSEQSVPSWSPLYKLDWPLNSTWHGLEIGLESETERIHFEWMTPMQSDIQGSITEYQWQTPTNPSQLDSLIHSNPRWNEGQSIDFGGEMKLTNRFFNWPIEIWPMLGFRWQRFNMTGYDIDSIVPPVGITYRGAAYTLSQQYYIFYVGGQLRANFVLAGVPFTLKFQGDWGATWGYNSDHHLHYDDGTLFIMQNTTGGSTHLALAAEARFHPRLSVGMQVDHMAIHTTGTNHVVFYSHGMDSRWRNGVESNSDQTTLTGYVRLRF